MLRSNVTGTPRWDLAREAVARLWEMPAQQAEANVEDELLAILRALFPTLSGSELMSQKPAGGGRIDVYCRNAVFEVKAPGKLDARVKPDGTSETPEEQAVRYLNALTIQPNMFNTDEVGWRAGTTDGKEWFFYDCNPDPAVANENKLTLINALRLDTLSDGEALLSYLYDFINRTVKMAPPTDDAKWADDQLKPFIKLATRYENSPEYDVKRSLWRGVLRGAFLNPQGDAGAERDLFARHTMLVVIARAVAETLRPSDQLAADREQLHDTLTKGFAAWVLDAGGDEGAQALDDLVTQVNSYEWRAPDRDILKNLYHAVIPRTIRHDFGEYYTPDWLARAVCEEVLDAKWRQETIAMAVAGQLNGPAVLDPSCGSGTFLYHATQLLLEDARRHPELAGSPQAQVEIVSALVAGMDLHPVAVELSKTTKMLAFGDLAAHYAGFADADTVHLCDSLQWETRRSRGTMEFGETVEIPTDEPDNPIRLPANLLRSERFPQLLEQIFRYANRPETPHTEDNLSAVLNLPNPVDSESALALYRQLREYIQSGRNNVWHWYIVNLIQPSRLSDLPVSRMVGNPPWVVYNAMSGEQPDDSDSEQDHSRQGIFRQRAQERGVWSSGTGRAPQNDLAATFVATCVDYYLQRGGKFGFVLPYAALRARQWEHFRSGQWPMRTGVERATHVDLSQAAWDLSGVNAQPFPQAQSSVVFGTKVRPDEQTPNLKPMADIRQIVASGVTPQMSWDDLKLTLQFTERKAWPIAPSEAYASAVLNGTNLFPQSLLVFERPLSRALGTVYFRTNKAKGIWEDTDREGQVEERFVKQALFSRLLIPFGATGHSHVVAPFSENGKAVLKSLPAGDSVQQFNLYWSSANADYVQAKRPKSPDTLAQMVDYISHLTAQLECTNNYKVVYNSSGGVLCSAVVNTDVVLSHTLCWISDECPEANHYLSAIFNAKCLSEFFSVACRASDRDFIHLPVQNLPIPAFDAGNEHHVNLAAQSQLAHERAAALVAERQDAGHRINRNDVLRDGAIQPILASIDESVRAILPDYCS